MSGSGPIYEYQRELTAKLEQAFRERDEARAEVARLRASVENLDALYASRTDSLRECEADVELWKKEAEEKQADFAMWFRLANDERKLTSQLRAEVARLREDNHKLSMEVLHQTCTCDGCEWHNPSEQGAQMRRDVAAHQREADERVMSSIYGEEAVTYLRATPLVTEGGK